MKRATSLHSAGYGEYDTVTGRGCLLDPSGEKVLRTGLSGYNKVGLVKKLFDFLVGAGKDSRWNCEPQ